MCLRAHELFPQIRVACWTHTSCSCMGLSARLARQLSDCVQWWSDQSIPLNTDSIKNKFMLCKSRQKVASSFTNRQVTSLDFWSVTWRMIIFSNLTRAFIECLLQVVVLNMKLLQLWSQVGNVCIDVRVFLCKHTCWQTASYNKYLVNLTHKNGTLTFNWPRWTCVAVQLRCSIVPKIEE